MVLSALVHVGAMVVFWLAPGDSSAALPPQVIAIELIEPPPSAPAPKPRAAPKPEPVPPAPKPPPKPEQVVLPEKPTQPKPKPKPKPPPKPREQKEVFREPEKKQEQNLEDLLAQMRGEAGETAPEAPSQTATVPSAGSSRGTGQLSAAERAWHAKVIRQMKRVWVVPPGFRTQDLETRVTVRLDAAGAILGTPQIVQRSGNPWYDEGVVRGLSKASPLPAPPEAGEWTIVFRPRDAF
ncbi:MAG: energy transducer TonB [Myxococcota bacterium]